MDAADLRGRLRGEVIEPSSSGYDEARALWNGMIDKRPALIARCTGPEDVAACLRFAREAGTLLAVRGGGHNVAGLASADGALVVDLSPMKELRVDAERGIVTAGGGVLLGELDAAAQAEAMATSLGVVSETGIAGLTLSGGVGWLRRAYGMSCDNLVGAEVVTADGELLRVSEDEHEDLLWGLRGGGGNFGVVTSFTYKAYRLGPEVMFCFVLYPGERAAEVLAAYGRYMDEAPDEVSPLAFLGRVQTADAFPAEWHGKPYAAVAAVYAGDASDGDRVLQPLRDLGEPIVDLSAPTPYVEVQKALDEDYPAGWRYYWKSIGLPELSEGVIERVVAHAEGAPSDHSTIDVWYHGGAMGRVDPSATAFGDRSAHIWIAPEANWEEATRDDENVAWARAVVEDMRGFTERASAYLNFPGFLEDKKQLLREAYGANYDRLVALKTRYDPDNVFRVNQNIPPR